MLMSSLKDIQIITQYLDCIYITLIYGVKNAAIQDRLQAVATFLQRFYNIVPYEAKYEECYYTSAGRISGEQETEAHVLLNSIFVAYASIFDLLAKVAVEQF